MPGLMFMAVVIAIALAIVFPFWRPQRQQPLHQRQHPKYPVDRFLEGPRTQERIHRSSAHRRHGGPVA